MSDHPSLAWITSKTLMLEAARSLKHLKLRRGLLTGDVRYGFCPVCAQKTLLVEEGPWLRDQLRCVRCRSIPRWRALIKVIEDQFPGWRGMDIHECSPSGPASKKLAAECPRYVATQYYRDLPGGAMRGEFRCENLEQQTFADESFDLVVSQDVLEHVFHPDRAFAEIARTLRPGGAHVFTVPWFFWQPTLVRATEHEGQVRHLMPPDYHGNPIDASGALVVTEWGLDLLDYIERSAKMKTTVHHLWDRDAGIDGDFRDVFVSRK